MSLACRGTRGGHTPDALCFTVLCRAAGFHPSPHPQVAVSDYMQQSNRPYSYINVFDNLRKKIPKGEKRQLCFKNAPPLEDKKLLFARGSVLVFP